MRYISKTVLLRAYKNISRVNNFQKAFDNFGHCAFKIFTQTKNQITGQNISIVET